MRGSLLFGVLALAGSGCVGNLGGDNRSGPSLGAETRPYCVSDYGHWHFWAECAEDVPLAPGDVVTSVSRGRVVSVYGSCGGAAGSGVRVDDGDGRHQYSHVEPWVHVGDWLEVGTPIGTVHDGSGAVYCDASLTRCAVGMTADRSTLCWSGPHLHREGACCRATDPPPPAEDPAPPPPAPYCGDGTCGDGEWCAVCAADCGECPPPEPPAPDVPACGVTSHLGAGENGDGCFDAPESWRCVYIPSWGFWGSQVCRSGVWTTYHLGPSDCGACCGGYSGACE